MNYNIGKIIFTLLMVSIFAGTVYGKEKNKFNQVTTQLTVTTRLTEWDEAMRQGLPPYNRKLEDVDYRFFAARVDDWLKSPDLELNSRIAKAWYVKLKNNLLYMAKLKRYDELSKMDANVSAAKVAKNQREIKRVYSAFVKLRKNPEMISKERLRFLKRKKLLEQKRRKKAS